MPIEPTARGQNPALTDASWPSADVTESPLAAEVLWGMDALNCCTAKTGLITSVDALWQAALPPAQGLKFSGRGGSSFINVIVTRRFGDMEGSSGNKGSVSALPATIKILPGGTPSASRICRRAFARSADNSHGPYPGFGGTLLEAVCPTIDSRYGIALS